MNCNFKILILIIGFVKSMFLPGEVSWLDELVRKNEISPLTIDVAKLRA